MLPIEGLTFRLMESNHSPAAQAMQGAWRDTKSVRAVDLAWTCADARVITGSPINTFQFNSIANGGDPQRIRQISIASRRGLVIAHFPCGGLIEKGKRIAADAPDSVEGDVHQYISEEIAHANPLQAAFQARWLKTHTGRETAALRQDHVTGEMSVLGIFGRNDGGPESHIPNEYFDRHTRHSSLPEDAVPYLAQGELTEDIAAYLEGFRAESATLFARIPDLTQTQQVQNPQFVRITDNLQPVPIAYPDLSEPNTVFRLTVLRSRERYGEERKRTTVDPKSLRSTLRQAEYPVAHAMAHRGTDQPFHGTSVVLFDFSDYHDAFTAATNFAQHPNTQEFVRDEENAILIAQNNAGTLRRIGRLRFDIHDGYVNRIEETNVFTPDK